MATSETDDIFRIHQNDGTSVEFVDRRVNFGNIPVNLPSSQTAVLKNTGHFHAYFKVIGRGRQYDMEIRKVFHER